MDWALRQHLYSINFLGYPKVEVATKRLSELNPHIEIEPLPLSLNVNNERESYDLYRKIIVNELGILSSKIE